MYRILGADGKEYGPVPTEQLRRWIAEGRANAGTPTRADGATEWKPLAQIPELSPLFATTAPPNPPLYLPARKTNSFAVAGLVFGILSVTGVFCCLGFPANFLGLIFSLIGLSQIKNNPELYDGKGMAVAGLVLSIFGLLLSLGLISFWALTASLGEPVQHFRRL